MPNNISHFSIHADNLPRARKFYEDAFGWKFTPWGPPDFFLIATGPEEDPGIHGALQTRASHDGTPMIGFECTISVDDIDAAAAAVESNGGQITVPKFKIPTVGTLIQFKDPEGNFVCAMQYESNQ
ncbi:MAG TPA: VOC family protein [Blastocatellia bacterium]|nr:VOC family protein [Blastocatellia bacterium]